MINSTLPRDGLPDLHNRTYAVLFSFVVALGLPLNAVSLWTLVRRHSLKSPSAIFMINLALSDLLLGISLPPRVYFYASGSWPFGVYVCTIFTMLFCNNIRSSSIFITFIGVDRFLAVVYPLRLRHLRTSCNAWKASCLVWSSLVVVNIPEGIHFTRNMEKCNTTLPFCFIDHPDCQMHLPEMVFLQSCLVFIMLATNIATTTLVAWTLRRHLSATAKVNSRVNVMLIFVMNLLMFAFCFLPLSVAYLLKDGNPVMLLCIFLASINCCLDPMLYYFSLDGFWKKKEQETSLGREEQFKTVGLDE